MNTPMPVNPGTVNVPAVTPTIGAIIGGIASAALTAKVGDPAGQVAIQTMVPALFAWIFHFAHSKLGTPE